MTIHQNILQKINIVSRYIDDASPYIVILCQAAPHLSNNETRTAHTHSYNDQILQHYDEFYNISSSQF